MPNDWFGLVRNARRKNPFSVCEMETSDFFKISEEFKTLHSELQAGYSKEFYRLVEHPLDQDHQR